MENIIDEVRLSVSTDNFNPWKDAIDTKEENDPLPKSSTQSLMLPTIWRGNRGIHATGSVLLPLMVYR
jgi:hypothetical protein